MFATAEKSIAAQLQELHMEATTVQEKIRVDTLKLQGAQSESGRISEGLARGTAKESELTKNVQEIAIIQARIDGNNAILVTLKTKINELAAEHYRQEQQAAIEARRKEFESLQRAGGVIRERILATMRRLITEDLVELNGVRDELALKFKDLGGENLGVQLGIFNTPSGVSLTQFELVVKEHWKMRGDVGFTIVSLHPPRTS